MGNLGPSRDSKSLLEWNGIIAGWAFVVLAGAGCSAATCCFAASAATALVLREVGRLRKAHAHRRGPCLKGAALAAAAADAAEEPGAQALASATVTAPVAASAGDTTRGLGLVEEFTAVANLEGLAK